MRFGSIASVFVVECGLLFMGLGIITVAVPANDRALLMLGYLPLTAVGFYHLWLALSRRTSFFSMCDIQAGTLFVSYFGGAAITLGLSQGGVLRFWSAPQSNLMLAASLYIVLFCAVLVLLGRIESRLWRGVWDIASQAGGWPRGIPVALAVLGLLQAVLIYRGNITFQGVGTFDGSKIPYGASLVVALSWPLFGICGWVFGRSELRHRPLLVLTCIALIPVELLFSLSYGRRVVLFQCLIFAVCFVWARRKGFSFGRVALAALAGLPLIYALWVVFVGLRMENNLGMFLPTERRDIFERLDKTMNLMRSNWTDVMRYQEVEVADRVFVIGYVVDLIGGAKPSNAFVGRAFTWEAINGVPRFIMPSKFVVARELHADEAAIALRYGLSVADRADSVLTSAFVDFHWLGVLYGLIVFAVGAFCVAVVRICQSRFVAVYVLCYALLQAVTPEQYFITESLNMIRLLVVLTPIFLAYVLVLRAGRGPTITHVSGFAQR